MTHSHIDDGRVCLEKLMNENSKKMDEEISLK